MFTKFLAATALKAVAKRILLTVLSEKVIARLTVAGLRHIATKTNNKVDDELVDIIEDAITPIDEVTK